MSGFKTKARTVELLGRKQIRDSVTALAELMKNAYDADAPWLRVEFSTTGSNQHVVIVDTGLGMSQNDIESKWLVLGTNSKTKRANKTSPSGRPLMGAKGIGRLASATLGKQLWMFTKTEESLWNIVFINWDIFENPYISIEDVRVPTRFGVSSQELILRFDSIIAEMLSEQRSNLENPGWYPENDIDGIVAPLLNGIRNSLSKASIEKKDVEKYIASFKCGTILHIDQLHDDWNRYIGRSGDRGVDVLATNIHGEYELIQCKRYRQGNNIGSTPIQRVHSYMRTRNASRAWVITTSDFTPEGRDEARITNVTIMNGYDLLQSLEIYYPGRFCL